MITDHTRVECRVLSILARGAKLVKLQDGLWSTGEKINDTGETVRDYMLARINVEAVAEARELRTEIKSGAVQPTAEALNKIRSIGDQVRAIREGFKGASAIFGDDLHDRLFNSGYLDDDGRITDAGQAYLVGCRDLARAVYDADPESLEAVIAGTGFDRDGRSIVVAYQGACGLLDVIERLAPSEM